MVCNNVCTGKEYRLSSQACEVFSRRSGYKHEQSRNIDRRDKWVKYVLLLSGCVIFSSIPSCLRQRATEQSRQSSRHGRNYVWGLDGSIFQASDEDSVTSERYGIGSRSMSSFRVTHTFSIGGCAWRLMTGLFDLCRTMHCQPAS